MPSTRFVDPATRMRIFGTRALDDFTVPAGQTWSVRGIQAMGSWFVGADHVIELPLPSSGAHPANITFSVVIFHAGTIQCKAYAVVPLPLPQVFTLEFAQSRCVLVGGHEAPDSSLVMSDEKFYIAIAPALDVRSQVFPFWQGLTIFSFIGHFLLEIMEKCSNGGTQKIFSDFLDALHGLMELNADFPRTALTCASVF